MIYEYKVVHLNDGDFSEPGKADEKLTELGKEGWRYVDDVVLGVNQMIVMERPVPVKKGK
jgi:hypothetical protein